MGRPKGPIRRVADALKLDAKTVRRALDAAGINEAEIASRFEEVCAAVRSIADAAKVMDHSTHGRGLGGSDSDSGYAAAKVEHTRQQTEKIRIQVERAQGRLISREAVVQTGTRLIAEVRTSLLSLGPRIADKVAGKTDAKEIAHAVTQEVRDVLGALSDSDRFIAALEDEAALS